jgi:radical SAM protein with 4Fe4S-binding SPASM domain
MIDQRGLMKAFERGGYYALQLEVGDRCEQACSYCYMNALETGHNTLSDRQIAEILDDSVELGVTALEWLGGEPLLRRGVFDRLRRARTLGLRNNIWTGGLPLAARRVAESCAELARPGLISVHVSSTDPEVYESLHPGRDRGDLEAILDGVRLLLDCGYPPTNMLNSMTFTGLQDPRDAIRTIDDFESRFGIRTSLNVYHTYLRPGSEPGALARFIPPPAAVSRVYKRWARQWNATEMPMNCVNKQYCSATLAVLCDGTVTPCATIRPADAPSIHDGERLAVLADRHRPELTFEPMRDPAVLPAECAACHLGDRCWGCRSRAYAAGLGVYGPDPRCFRPTSRGGQA